MAHYFPPEYTTSKCYLVPINASLLPIVAGSLAYLQERYAWVSDEDYQLGYQAFGELKACLMRLCVDALIESNDRLYRMLDTALYGRQYTITSTNPLEVEPAITPAHALVIEDQDSVLGRMENLRQLLENALNGTETPNYDRTNGVRDLLEQLLSAVQNTGQLDDDMLGKLAEIAVLLG